MKRLRNVDVSLVNTEFWVGKSRHSLQPFVVEFDICLVWELLFLPSDAQTAPNLPSLKCAKW